MSDDIEIGDEVLKRIAAVKDSISEEVDTPEVVEVKPRKKDGRQISSQLNAAKARATKLAKCAAKKVAGNIDSEAYEKFSKNNTEEIEDIKENLAAMAQAMRKMMEMKHNKTKAKVQEPLIETKQKKTENKEIDTLKKKLINY